MKTIITILSLITITHTAQVMAQFGTLDVTFDSDGIQTLDINSSSDYITDMAIQTDGKIISAGFSYINAEPLFVVARHMTDGSIDTSFGVNGITIIDFDVDTVNLNECTSVAIQPDGKIVLAGFAYMQTNDDFALARLNTDGTLDISFDGDGKRTIHAGFSAAYNAIYDIVIDANEKIVFAGYIKDMVNDDDFAIGRLNSDGSTDSTFGNSGITQVDFNTHDDRASGLIILNDNRIAVCGKTDGFPNVDFGLVLLSASGNLDNSFDADGKLLTDFGSNSDEAKGIAQQQDGKLVVSGSYTNFSFDFCVARYNLDGALDNSFSSDGKVITDVSPTSTDDGDEGGIIIQPDGKILLSGFVCTSFFSDFGLIRYNSDGSLDSTFGNSGKVITDLGSLSDYGYAMAIQPDLKILVGGSYDSGSNAIDFAIARYDVGLIGLHENGFVVKAELYPNPVVENAILKYQLLNKTHITIEIIDMNGTIVEIIADKVLKEPGEYLQTISIPKSITSGNYCIIISSKNGYASIKFKVE